MIDWFWVQGMQAGHKNTFDCVKAFSETEFTDDLTKLDVPTLVFTATTTRSCRSVPRLLPHRNSSKTPLSKSMQAHLMD
jgi:hypothetical protein